MPKRKTATRLRTTRKTKFGLAATLAAATVRVASADMIAVDYESGIDANRIYTVDPSFGRTALIEQFRFDTGGYYAPSLTFDEATGHVYAAAGSGMLYQFDLQTGTHRTFAGTDFMTLTSVGDGKLWGAQRVGGGNVIVRSFEPATGVQTDVGNYDIGVTVYGSLDVDPLRNELIWGSDNETIYQLNLASRQLKPLAVGEPLIDVELAPDGRLFAFVRTGTGTAALIQIDRVTGEIHQIGTTFNFGLVLPTLVIDQSANLAYFAAATGQLHAFDLTTGELIAFPLTDLRMFTVSAPPRAVMYAPTPELQAIARALHALPTSTTDLSTVLTELNSLHPDAIPAALEALRAVPTNALASTSFAGSGAQTANVFARADQHRTGHATFGAAALDLEFADAAPAFDDPTPANYLDGPETAPAPLDDSPNPYRWSAFAVGSATIGDFETTPDATGFEFHTTGLTVGLDRRFGDRVVAGAFTSYSYADAELARDAGDSQTQSIRAGVFASFTDGPWGLDGLVSVGHHAYDLARHIRFGGLSETATASPDGFEVASAVQAGYDVTLPHDWVLTPTASLAYTHVWIDGYTESGAGPLNLRVDDQTAESLRSRLGVNLARELQLDRFTLTPHVGVAWQHEFIDDPYAGAARFATGADAFAFETGRAAPDTLVLTAGATLHATDRWSLSADYTTELNDDYQAHALHLSVRVRF